VFIKFLSKSFKMMEEEMKKGLLILIAAIMVSSLLLASGPALRVVRLTVINKSGNEVYLRLEGSDVGKQFYYLTIPAGTKTSPTVRVFTVVEDVYKRTTTYGPGKYKYCYGMTSVGQLVMASNNRLTFTPCQYNPPSRLVTYCYIPGVGLYPPGQCPSPQALINLQEPNYGEPTMEKVVFSQFVNLFYGTGDWQSLELMAQDDWRDLREFRLNVNWKRGCGFNTYLYWYYGTTRFPQRGLCRWRYLYDYEHEGSLE
jgi:hypothetical protein